MSKREYRRIRLYEAAKLIPFYFVGMFAGKVIFDLAFDDRIDWTGALIIAALWSFTFAVIQMVWKLKPKYR